MFNCGRAFSLSATSLGKGRTEFGMESPQPVFRLGHQMLLFTTRPYGESGVWDEGCGSLSPLFIPGTACTSWRGSQE